MTCPWYISAATCRDYLAAALALVSLAACSDPAMLPRHVEEVSGGPLLQTAQPTPPKTVYVDLSEQLGPIAAAQVIWLHEQLGIPEPAIVLGECMERQADSLCIRYGDAGTHAAVTSSFDGDNGVYWVTVIGETSRPPHEWEIIFRHEYIHAHIGFYAGFDGLGHSAGNDIMAPATGLVECESLNRSTVDVICTLEACTAEPELVCKSCQLEKSPSTGVGIVEPH